MNEPSLEQRLTVIEERNARVEADKAWEVSITRRVSIAVITYVIACIVFRSIGTPNVFLSACIPVIGYILSTLSLPFLKSSWLRSRKR